MGLIRTRLEGPTRSSIALSIIAMNIDKLAKAFLCPKTVLEFSRYNCGTKAEILLFIPHNQWDYLDIPAFVSLESGYFETANPVFRKPL